MKRYPEYKDSGMVWLDEIPSQWGEKWLKHLFKFEKGRNAQVYTKEYVSDNPGEYPLYSGQTENNCEMGKISSFEYNTGPTIFVTTVGAKAMTTRVVKGRYSLSQNCALIRLRISELSVYYYEYLLQQLFRYEKGRISLIMQPSLRFEDLVLYKIPFPSIDEQFVAARFLTHKTRLIDTLIAKKQKQIELLQEQRATIINQAVTKGLNPNVKMKDSGIEWLGEVPEHWNVFKLKLLTTKIGSGITPRGGAEVYRNAGIPLLRSQNIHFNGLRLDDVACISQEIHDSMNGTKVKPDDVLINITGASIGRCIFVPDSLKEANVNQHVCILRPNGKIWAQYLYYFLSSNLGQDQVFTSQVGTSREGLNFEQLKNFFVIVPPKDEQVSIVRHLNFQGQGIFNAVGALERQIQKIQEYRTTLISEVVTGKIDVRDEAIP